jgi:RimK family alpha-L-glutamate ligase
VRCCRGSFSDGVKIAIVCRTPSPTTVALSRVALRGVEIVPMTPTEAAGSLRADDAALGRLDVLPTLDGIEDGLWALGVLDARGITVLNGPATLLATHDKLVTARILRRAGLPHPVTCHVRGSRPAPSIGAPAVVKPRHGSWGAHVVACETDVELEVALQRVEREPWYLQHGALVQELVRPTGYDLRLVVAGNRVVGAIRREAAPGEWRTNVALGASRVPIDPPADAVRLALAAARAASATLVGVDLLPTPDGGFAILELNGAVDFTVDYGPERDVFREAALEIAAAALVTGERRLGSMPAADSSTGVDPAAPGWSPADHRLETPRGVG